MDHRRIRYFRPSKDALLWTIDRETTTIVVWNKLIGNIHSSGNSYGELAIFIAIQRCQVPAPRMSHDLESFSSLHVFFTSFYHITSKHAPFHVNMNIVCQTEPILSRDVTTHPTLSRDIPSGLPIRSESTDTVPQPNTQARWHSPSRCSCDGAVIQRI